MLSSLPFPIPETVVEIAAPPALPRRSPAGPAATPLSALPDHALTARLDCLAARERAVTMDLIEHLCELDRRRLWARHGFSSLFAYCRRRLRLAESSAYRRIQAARLYVLFPQIAPGLRAGRLNLTSLLLLQPVLTADNADRLLSAAAGRRKREVRALVAAEAPRPDVPDRVRRLPRRRGLRRPETQLSLAAAAATPAEAGAVSAASALARPAVRDAGDDAPPAAASPPAVPQAGAAAAAPALPAAPAATAMLDAGPLFGAPAAEPRRDRTEPLSPGRHKVEFTAGDDLVADLERARERLSHRYPQGRLEDVIGEALRVLLRVTDPLRGRRGAGRAGGGGEQAAGEPGAGEPGATAGGRVSAALRRAVHERDGGRCTYLGEDGQRCESRWQLQIDHRKPRAAGGETSLSQMRLLCRAHNDLEARRWFGSELVDRRIRERRERAGGLGG